MSRKKYFSYIRVSTQRQGHHGTSLAEQQSSIERFARNWDLQIVKRYEERETAAKQGRPVFLEMLKQLKRRKADGVIIHKIDRSARNLKDWADLGSLIDNGLEVHFASESLDLNSRGGRLSADIQAVVASDFIRNLREETKKGLYGRLRQGFYPFRAVVGYLDCGAGKAKEIDPVNGPLVQKAFEFYATGDIGLHALSEKLYEMGLRSRVGKMITLNGLSTLLHNPFYTGVIKIQKTGEVFAGVHQSLVSKELFDQVQNILAGKNVKKENRHFFTYRRMIRCRNCGNSLIPEQKKEQYTYYRCHTRRCPRTALKEESITAEYLKLLRKLKMSEREMDFFRREGEREIEQSNQQIDLDRANLLLQQEKSKNRISALTDALIDGIIDNDTFLAKKNQLIFEERALTDRINNCLNDGDSLRDDFGVFMELLNSAYQSYKSAPPHARRELAKTVTLEFSAEGKSGLITLKPAFQLVADRPPFPSGRACREATRKRSAWIRRLLKVFEKNGPREDSEIDPRTTSLGVLFRSPITENFRNPLNNSSKRCCPIA